MLGLWCLMQLSTIFQLYREGQLLVGGNGVPGETHSQIVSHNVASSTPRHEWGSNSHIWW